MNKGMLGKISLFSIALLILIAFIISVLPAFSATFTPVVNPSDVSASSTNQILTFTIVDTNTTANITQVNITLPAGFSFLTSYSNTTTASNTVFSNVSTLVRWSNTTETGFIVNGSAQNFSINLSVPSVASTAYKFNVSTLDTSGEYSSVNVTVTVNDTTYPAWLTNQSSTPTNYSSSTLSEFNISWTDNVALSKVFIEGNWSASNASMTNDYGGNVYNYSIVLPAGVWQWKSYANDTKGNMNVSSTFVFSIAQTAPTLGLTNYSSSTYSTTTIVNGSITTADTTGYNISLYRDGSLVNSTTSLSSIIENIILGVGAWNYTLAYNGTQNYSANIATNFTSIAKGTPNVRVYINELITNQTITYPSTATIKGNSSSSGVLPTFSLLIINATNSSQMLLNNTTSSPIFISQLLGAGVYNITFNTSGNANWSEAINNTLNLSVSQNATNPVILTLNNGTNNYNDKNVTATYPTSIIANCSMIYSSSGSCSLYRDNTSIGTNETVTFGVGTYNYTVVASGNNNYSANNTGETFYAIVSKGNPTSTMNISINGTANDSTLTYPYPTNITGWSTITGQNSSSLTFNLYNNSALVNSSTTAPYSITDQNLYGVSTYTYIYNTSGNANYTNGTVARTLTISQGTPTLTISGPTNWAVTYPSSATVLCTAPSEVTAFLYRDGANTTSTTETVSSSIAASYNYTCNSSATTNYTAGYATPQLLTLSPASSNQGSTGSIPTTSSGTIHITLGAGKTNITIDSLTTSGKLIANIAKYQDVAIRGMNITVVNNVANIKIMITKIATLPSSVPFDIQGKAYNYINIDKANITDSDIGNVSISFAVNKTWLTANNVDYSNITLYRWANNKWNDLGATKVSEDTVEVFYAVNSPGLSVFVIGTKGVQASAPSTTSCTENWSCGNWSSCSNNQQTRTCTDANNCGTIVNKPAESQSCAPEQAQITPTTSFPVMNLAIVIVIVIIVCIVIFLERSKITSYLKKTKKK